jgi:hypothetical protein
MIPLTTVGVARMPVEPGFGLAGGIQRHVGWMVDAFDGVIAVSFGLYELCVGP